MKTKKEIKTDAALYQIAKMCNIPSHSRDMRVIIVARAAEDKAKETRRSRARGQTGSGDSHAIRLD